MPFAIPLDSWLCKPSWKQNKGRFTLIYHFETEGRPIVKRKVKIEINTREHFKVHQYLIKDFSVTNSWFTGEAKVLTYSLEELLGTKLRALYQRKKGRDLYDLWYVEQNIKELDKSEIMKIFSQYMKFEGNSVSCAEFERNIFLKMKDKFNNDIFPLLPNEQSKQYQTEINKAYDLLLKQFISKLEGQPWKAGS